MQSEALWKKFEISGSVEDYLAYSKEKQSFSDGGKEETLVGNSANRGYSDEGSQIR